MHGLLHAHCFAKITDVPFSPYPLEQFHRALWEAVSWAWSAVRHQNMIHGFYTVCVFCWHTLLMQCPKVIKYELLMWIMKNYFWIIIWIFKHVQMNFHPHFSSSNEVSITCSRTHPWALLAVRMASPWPLPLELHRPTWKPLTTYGCWAPEMASLNQDVLWV